MHQIVDEACRHLRLALEQQPDATVYESCLVQLMAFQGKQVSAGKQLADVANDVAPSVSRAELRLHWLQRHQPGEVAARGASVVQSDRGGNITFHGPGQLVAYPILDLRAHKLDVRGYVGALEDVMIDTAAPDNGRLRHVATRRKAASRRC